MSLILACWRVFECADKCPFHLRAFMPPLELHVPVQVTDMMDVSKQAWCEQPWKVLTGGMCFEKTHGGSGFWDWLEAHPATEDGFSRAMTEVDSLGESCKNVTGGYACVLGRSVTPRG